MRKLWIVVAVVIGLVLVRLSFYTVSPAEYVYVTQFGKHLATYDGSQADEDAGLHFGWPWPVQSVQRLDRRLQYFDLPATELPTRDADNSAGDKAENRIDKMLIVEAYVCWRIGGKESVGLFIRTLGTSERAQDILGQRINSHLGAAISQLSTKDLINTDAELVKKKMGQLWKELLGDLKPDLAQEYGIDLVDVRLRRFYHSPKVLPDIYEAIKAKRKQKAEEYYSKGKLEKRKIMDDADYKAAEIEADALKYKMQKEREGEYTALDIRGKAHDKDPELFRFLKKMEVLGRVLKNNQTMLLLSINRTFFEGLIPGPHSEAGPLPGTGGPKSKDKGNGEKPLVKPGGGT